MLLARAHEDLQDGVHPVGDAGDGEDRQVLLRLAHVAGELGHGPAQAGDGVLVHPVVQAELAFQHQFGPGDGSWWAG